MAAGASTKTGIRLTFTHPVLPSSAPASSVCSCALWLQRKGFAVTLIDPEPTLDPAPRRATPAPSPNTVACRSTAPTCSSAAAGAAVLEVTARCRWIFGYALSHPGWMLQFSRSTAEKEKVDRITRLLGKPVGKRHTTAWIRCSTWPSARDLVRQNGCICDSMPTKPNSSARQTRQSGKRRAHGRRLRGNRSGPDIAELEPGI